MPSGGSEKGHGILIVYGQISMRDRTGDQVPQHNDMSTRTFPDNQDKKELPQHPSSWFFSQRSNGPMLASVI